MERAENPRLRERRPFRPIDGFAEGPRPLRQDELNMLRNGLERCESGARLIHLHLYEIRSQDLATDWPPSFLVAFSLLPWMSGVCVSISKDARAARYGGRSASQEWIAGALRNKLKSGM
jgi:hypothetical protein